MSDITRHIRDIMDEILDDIKDLRKGLNNLSDEVVKLHKEVLSIKNDNEKYKI